MHTPIHEQRLQLMPVEKAMPIAETVELLKQYAVFQRKKVGVSSKEESPLRGDLAGAAVPHQRRLTFEYTMLKGVNDTMTHAKELLRLLRGLDCRINLIRYHRIPDVELQGCDMKTMENFRDYLTAHGITTTIRASRGEDIYAACGLLNTKRKAL